MAQSVKSLPAMRMTWVWSLSWEALLEKEMATHSSIPVWRTPMDRGAWWATQFMGSQSVGWDSRTNLHFSLSSYFELSNYSFSRNCFTLAKTKKKKANQQISHFRGSSFQRKALLAASAAALRYPWGGASFTSLTGASHRLHSKVQLDKEAPGEPRTVDLCPSLLRGQRLMQVQKATHARTWATHHRGCFRSPLCAGPLRLRTRNFVSIPGKQPPTWHSLNHSQSMSTFQRRYSSDIWK